MLVVCVGWLFVCVPSICVSVECVLIVTMYVGWFCVSKFVFVCVCMCRRCTRWLFVCIRSTCVSVECVLIVTMYCVCIGFVCVCLLSQS